MARLLGLLFALLTIGLFVGGAAAQDTKKSKLEADALFKKLDANKDGKLQKDEFLKLAERFKDKVKARAKLTMAFEKIDPRNHGVTREVFRTYLDSVRKKKEQH